MKFSRTYSTPGDPYAGVTFRAAYLAHRQPRRIGDFRGARRHGSGDLESGRRRRACAKVLPQSRRPEGDDASRRGGRAGLAPALDRRRTARWRRCRATTSSGPSATRARSSTAWRDAGRTGAGSTATSIRKTTRKSISTRCARCSPARSARRTRRNGSTPACIGRTAFPGPAQGHWYVDPADGIAKRIGRYLFASAGQRLLYPWNRGRSRQRGRHLRWRHARSAHL